MLGARRPGASRHLNPCGTAPGDGEPAGTPFVRGQLGAARRRESGRRLHPSVPDETPRKSPRPAPHGWRASRTQSRHVSPCNRSPSAVDHATPVQRPEPEVANEHRDNGAGRNRGRGWPHLDPVEVKVLPRHERRLRAFESLLPVTDGHGCLVEVVPCCRGLRDTDASVRERQVPTILQRSVRLPGRKVGARGTSRSAAVHATRAWL